MTVKNLALELPIFNSSKSIRKFPDFSGKQAYFLDDFALNFVKTARQPVLSQGLNGSEQNPTDINWVRLG